MNKRASNTVTIKGRTVTTEDVQAAMDECDRLGLDAFLSSYGFKRATTYWLRGPSNHRPYPSKAILCVAAGFTGKQLSGGAYHTVTKLNALGFEVRNGDEIVGAVGIDALREQAVADGFADPAPEWDKVAALGVTPLAYFASGSNQVGQIRGFAAIGHDIGVAADYVSARPEAELVKLAGSYVQVFLDSGAFSEVVFRTLCADPRAQLVAKKAKRGEHSHPRNRSTCEFCGTHRRDQGGPQRIVKPITDADWQKRLALYARLADKLGDQLWVVAPDQVGSQAVTLERLARYSAELVKLADTGAQVMLVAQKGELTQAEFYAKALEVSGLAGRSNVVPALPCAKAATTAAEVAEFVAAVKPEHVHLLGKGPQASDIADYLAPFAGSSTTVSLDSCWITGNVGKTNGPAGGPRRYTKANAFASQVLTAAGRIASATSKAAEDVALRIELALALCLAAPLPSPSSSLVGTESHARLDARRELRSLWRTARAEGAKFVAAQVEHLLALVPDARPAFVALAS